MTFVVGLFVTGIVMRFGALAIFPTSQSWPLRSYAWIIRPRRAALRPPRLIACWTNDFRCSTIYGAADEVLADKFR
jgi:hypothetical protein